MLKKRAIFAACLYIGERWHLICPRVSWLGIHSSSDEYVRGLWGFTAFSIAVAVCVKGCEVQGELCALCSVQHRGGTVTIDQCRMQQPGTSGTEAW